MRRLPRYPDLHLTLEQGTALRVWNHWNGRKISTPFAGFLPKGEIGINPAHPSAAFTIWTVRTGDRGLLHLDERLAVRSAPRLADLTMTAMRRDEHGKAAGHAAAAQPAVMPGASRRP